MKLNQSRTNRSLGVVTLALPGADRARSLAVYHFRVTYKNPDPAERGCVMTWDVSGGRLPYQIAVERLDTGNLQWHCTCADAVYRGDGQPNYQCKHVQGLLQIMPAGG
jgi:hypothetical protein